jgi:hypothetical protein
MKNISISVTERKLKYQTLAVNLILLLTLTFSANSVIGQNNELTIEPFSYSNFGKVISRVGSLSSYPISEDVKKKIKYTQLELDNNSTERIKKVISLTWKTWHTVGIVGKFRKKELALTNVNSRNIEKTTSNQNGYRYFQENFRKDGSPMEIRMSSLKTASLIVINENDTLILLPKKITVFDKATSQYKKITLLYYKDLKTINLMAKAILQVKKDVLNLKYHFSFLEGVGLKLTESEKEELNTNIQTRIIESLESFRLPKYYFVSVNRTEGVAQTKSYFYIVEKHSKNLFYSLGKKHDEFPLMDTVLNSQILIDSVQLNINKDELSDIVRSTDYLSQFTSSRTFYNDNNNATKYYRVLGRPNFNSSETLFVTTSGDGYSNLGIPLQLEKFPSYSEFTQNYLTKVKLKDFPLSKLKSRGNPLVEKHTYSKDLISFNVNIELGSKVNPMKSRYGSTVYGSNKKEIYGYAVKFHKIYRDLQKRKKEEREKEELAEKQKEEQQKQELVKKYGKKYVDALYKMTIIVGMHEDLVNVIVNKLYTVGSVSSSASGDFYRLDPRYGTGWVYVSIKNKKVTSVSYH